jgi:hypothetical protein
MSQLLKRVSTTNGGIGPPFAVCLSDTQAETLTLRSKLGMVVATLRSAGLNRGAIVRWCVRHEILLLDRSSDISGELLPGPLLQLPTFVVCVDSRVRDIASLYARSVGARLCVAESVAEVAAAIEQSETDESVSLFLLNDRLQEELCHAIAVANRSRRASGRVALSYGFFSAFTLEQLAWLVVKSWIIFLRPYPKRAGFAHYESSTGDSFVHFRSTETGATTIQHTVNPWLADDIMVLGLRSHGASFDVSMGHVVLCGKLDPPLPRQRRLRAPSCFHDNICFRMNGSNEAPTEILRAIDASPLVWCLESCASVPLTGNAFGEGTSYVFGLIAGAAVGVIGPFMDITTTGAMNHQCEVLLATGATLGETVAAVCNTQENTEFDKFLLIGSPDLRLLPLNRAEAERDGERWLFNLRGKFQYTWRLAIPPEVSEPIYVVGDDGNEHWTSATCYRFEHGLNRDLLVALDEPADVDGWVLVGVGGKSNQWFGEEATRIQNNLKVLRLCPFVDPKALSVERCQSLAKLLLRVTNVPDRLRCRVDTTISWANLQALLNELHLQVADTFVKQVAEHDVNLDRVPGHGFKLGPTKRTNERCPTCGVALYVTNALWRKKSSYVRRWIQCVNCSGVSMVLRDSPLVIQVPAADVSPDGLSLLINLEIGNRTELPVQALVAGLARRGSLDDRVGPIAVIVSPGSFESINFSAPLNPNVPGVISYRLLVLCDAGVELFAFKYVIEPTVTPLSTNGQGTKDPINSSTLASVEPVSAKVGQ